MSWDEVLTIISRLFTDWHHEWNHKDVKSEEIGGRNYVAAAVPTLNDNAHSIGFTTVHVNSHDSGLESDQVSGN